MESKAIIGRNIKACREKLHYTQEMLANYLGIQREVVSYYENGRRAIELSLLERLADLFGVDLEALLTDEVMLDSIDPAIAFRLQGFTSSDLIKISEFQRIMKSYRKMIKLETENGN